MTPLQCKACDTNGAHYCPADVAEGPEEMIHAAIAKPPVVHDVCIACETEITDTNRDLDSDTRCWFCADAYRDELRENEAERRAEAEADRQEVREERGRE